MKYKKWDRLVSKISMRILYEIEPFHTECEEEIYKWLLDYRDLQARRETIIDKYTLEKENE